MRADHAPTTTAGSPQRRLLRLVPAVYRTLIVAVAAGVLAALLLIGLVLALAHTSWVYYLFKGKVRLEAGSHY